MCKNVERLKETSFFIDSSLHSESLKECHIFLANTLGDSYFKSLQ